MRIEIISDEYFKNQNQQNSPFLLKLSWYAAKMLKT